MIWAVKICSNIICLIVNSFICNKKTLSKQQEIEKDNSLRQSILLTK